MGKSYQLRKITCNLCGHNDCALVTSERTFSICRCQHCGLLYVNPQPNDWPSTDSSGSFDYYGLEGRLTEVPSRYIPAFESALRNLNRVRDYLPGPRLLDIGCGVGIFLGLAMEQGWDVYGQDISAIACEHARSVVGHEKVFHMRLESLCKESKESPFDVCILWCVLEHVEDPMQLLQTASELITPGGTILVRVPNTGGLHRLRWRFQRLLGKETISLLGGVPAHLHGFTTGTIKQYLSRAGFSNVRFQGTNSSGYRGPMDKFLFQLSRLSALLTGGRYTVGPILVTGKKKTNQ